MSHLAVASDILQTIGVNSSLDVLQLAQQDPNTLFTRSCLTLFASPLQLKPVAVNQV